MKALWDTVVGIAIMGGSAIVFLLLVDQLWRRPKQIPPPLDWRLSTRQRDQQIHRSVRAVREFEERAQ